MICECKFILFSRPCRKPRMSPSAEQQVDAGFISHRFRTFCKLLHLHGLQFPCLFHEDNYTFLAEL